MKMLMYLTFRRKILICIVELLKVFLHPPLGKEKVSWDGRINDIKTNRLVNRKARLRKLSFKDYYLKSGITNWILTLRKESSRKGFQGPPTIIYIDSI